MSPARRRVLAAIGATLLAGLLTYVYLGIVSRQLDAAAFDRFSLFWSIALVVGIGFFAPVEQELARQSTAESDADRAVRSTVPVTLVIAVVVAVGAAVVAGVAGGADAGVILCCALAAPVSAVQYLARGNMLGSSRLGWYSGVLAADSVLRLVLVTVVALLPVVSPREASWFAGAILGGILLAHLPALVRVRRRGPLPAGSRTDATRAVLALLGAGIASQVLLNGGTVAIQVLQHGVGEAGAFQATFNVARIPLFVLVPLQSLLVPPLVRLIEAGRAAQLRRRLGATAAAIVGVGVVGAALAWVLGPWIVGLVFGADRALPGALIAALVLGVCINVVLVVFTQVLVAMRRHSRASIAWTAGLIVAAALAVVLHLIGVAITPAVCVGFAVGSALGAAVAGLELFRPIPGGPRPTEESSPPVASF